MLLEPMKVEPPVMNTFIQYPALRMSSLEGFLNERETKSCPASRMMSLEEEPEAFGIPTAALLTQAAQKTSAFLVPRDCTVDSLEEFFMDRESKPAATSQVAPMMSAFIAPRDCTVDSLEEFFMDRESKPATAAFPEVGFPKENTAFQVPTFFQYPIFSEVSTAASTASERTEPVTPDLSDDEAETQVAKKSGITISLTDGLGIESKGSAEHMAGTCKPCAFLWKPEGCKQGQSCSFCHLCPIGEVKRRKKEKLALRKMARGYQIPAQNGMYCMF